MTLSHIHGDSRITGGRWNMKGAEVGCQEGVMQGRQGTCLAPTVYSHPHKAHCA